MISGGTIQGCSLFPILFNIYSEAILRDALGGVNKGIRVEAISLRQCALRMSDQATLASSVIYDAE